MEDLGGLVLRFFFGGGAAGSEDASAPAETGSEANALAVLGICG